MDKYSAVYFVKTNEVLVIGDLTTHLCSHSSTGACGAALGLPVVWGDVTAAQLLASAGMTGKLGYAGGNQKGQHSLGKPSAWVMNGW